MDKYSTHYNAWSKIDDSYVTIPAPSTQISNKLIKKSELSTYSLKISSTPKKQYTDNQCVLERDIVPSYTNTNITKLRMQRGHIGVLDSQLEGAFYYVTKKGPWEYMKTDYEHGGILSYSSFYPDNDSTFTIDIPYADDINHDYVIEGCKGGDMYMEYGPGGIYYIDYGIGFDLAGSFYSYYDCDYLIDDDIVFVQVSCSVEFWNGSNYNYSKIFKPTKSTPIAEDGSNIVYQHDINISFNSSNSTTDENIANHIQSGFIDCGTGDVKNITLAVDVFGSP